MYFNTGSAGRFENLVWGLEIVGGQPTLVGWTHRDGPGLGPLERHLFQASGDQLRATVDPVPL